jgi:predicted molibdopterin-dependent oxidoreductase YjgC
VELRVDGVAVSVPDGATILEACDQAGRYVPRLCSYPKLGCQSCLPATTGGVCCDGPRDEAVCCGICAVRLDSAATDAAAGAEIALACCTPAQPGMAVVTEGAALQAERLGRLAGFLARHPHICLSCPDRDGCSREDCTFGIPAEARCCDEFGRCEFGKLVAHVDAAEQLPRRAVVVPRDATMEGRIRREPGLCLGCGRCVVVCSTSPAAGKALRMAAPGSQSLAVPQSETLRASGCTFCGQCVMVCPTGAVTAPGDDGARWLEGWRKRTGLPMPPLPPEPWRPITSGELAALPSSAGVFLLAGGAGEILRIQGVADLGQGVRLAIAEPACGAAVSFRFEPAPFFTQRESELLARFVQQQGHLPPGNDLSDDLFSNDLFEEDLE